MIKYIFTSLLLLSCTYGLAQVGVGTVSPNSTLDVNGSMSMPIRSGTTAYTLTSSDYTYLTNNSVANAANVTLPTAVGIEGRIYIIKNTGTGRQNVLTTGTETIEGATSYAPPFFSPAYTIIVQSDGANWWILSSFFF